MAEQLPALHLEIPDFMFVSRSNGLTRQDNDLKLSHRMWFSKDFADRSYAEDCAMIGQLSARLVVRRAEFVDEFLPDCTEGEFEKIAERINFIHPGGIHPSVSEEVSYASARKFIDDSETFVSHEGTFIEDVVWYIRAHICLLERAYGNTRLPRGFDVTEAIDAVTRIQEDEAVDKFVAAEKALSFAGVI